MQTARLLACPQGHLWDGLPDLEEARPLCPECGLELTRTTAGDAPLATAPPPDTHAVGLDEPAEIPRAAPHTPESPYRGRFRIIRPHAQGGLGQVSLAQDEELGREVALKEIRGDLAAHIGSRRRFITEAQITGQLEHPNIVPIYALGRDESGRPYYAMRFLKGRSLHRAIQDYHASPSSAGMRDLLRRFVDVCRAMAYAHSRGIVHRDLKPANVMLGDYGETLVVDWGIAMRIASAVPVNTGENQYGAASSAPAAILGLSSSPTLVGQLLGTRPYMAPEQAKNASAADVTSDVYSLGATLQHMLTGVPPGEPGGSAPGKALKTLAAVAAKAMNASPRARYRSANDLGDEIERFLADEPVQAYREPLIERAGRWTRRHTAHVAVGVAVLVTAVVAASIGLHLLARERDRHDAALASEQIAQVVRQNVSADADRRVHDADRRLLQAMAEMAAHHEQASQFGEARRALWRARHVAATRLPIALPALDTRLLATFRDGPGPLSPVPLARNVKTAAFFPDSRRILVGGTGGAVTVVDAATCAIIRVLHERGEVVDAVAVAEDGQSAASADASGLIRVWSLNETQSGVSLPRRSPGTTALAINHAHLWVASCGDDRMVRVSSIEDDKPPYEASLPAPADRLAVSPGGDVVIAVLKTGDVLAWNSATWEQVAHLAESSATRPASPLSPEIAAALGAAGLSRDGRPVVRRTENGLLVQSSLSPRIGQRQLTPRGEPAVISQRLYEVLPGGHTPVMALETTPTLHVSPSGESTSSGSTGLPLSMIVAPDGRLALGITPGGDLEIWCTDPAPARGWRGLDAKGMSSVSLSPDGMLVAGGCEDGAIHVWDVATGFLLREFNQADGPIRNITFSRDGKLVFTAGTGPDSLRAWNLASSKEVATPKLSANVTALGTSSGGNDVAIGLSDGSLAMWNPREPQRLFRANTIHRGEVKAVSVGRDGAVVSAGVDGKVCHWDPFSSEPARVVASGTKPLHALVSVGDGSAGAALGAAGTVVEWQITPQLSQKPPQIPQHDCSVNTAAILTGSLAITGASDGRLRFWDMGTGSCFASVQVSDAPVLQVSTTGTNDGYLAFLDGRGRASLMDLGLPMRQAAMEVAASDALQMPESARVAARTAAVLGRWWMVRGRDDWAVDLLRSARERGEAVSRIELGRALVRANNLRAAAKEFGLAQARGDATDDYLGLLSRALAIPADGTSTNANSTGAP